MLFFIQLYRKNSRISKQYSFIISIFGDECSRESGFLTNFSSVE